MIFSMVVTSIVSLMNLLFKTNHGIIHDRRPLSLFTGKRREKYDSFRKKSVLKKRQSGTAANL